MGFWYIMIDAARGLAARPVVLLRGELCSSSIGFAKHAVKKKSGLGVRVR